MKLNQKGEGKAGAIFGFAVFALVLYLAFKIVPVMIRVYAYEDAVTENCKFMHGRSDDELISDLVDLAAEKDLPVNEEDISLSRVKIESHVNLQLTIDYSVPITTPFMVYNWKQHVSYDAPVFD